MATMADDSMELASDPGHGIGDEDIDIDIDLTAGPADEDYILEDAFSTTEGENIEHQLSPYIGDDLMVDENDGSYTLEDADIHDPHEHNEAAMSFDTMIDQPRIQDEVTNDIIPVGVQDDQNELSWEDEPQATLENNSAQVVPEAASYTENDNNSVDVITGAEESEAQAVHREEQEHESRTITPHAPSPTALPVEDSQHPPVERVVSEQPAAESATETTNKHSAMQETEREVKVELAVQQTIQDDFQSAGEAESISEHDPGAHGEDVANNNDNNDEIYSSVHDQGQREIEPELEAGTATQKGDSIPNVGDITVLYRNGEYALFGAPESDDPDSFFLSDHSIADKPISDLFTSMREVIREELTPEDELCLTVEELGLEIEETVSSLYNVTILQIFELHQKLQLNDGAEQLRPLFIRLHPRTNFARRLANLMAEADDGKGLSQVVIWDEDESEELGNYQEIGEYQHSHGSATKDELVTEDFGNNEDTVAMPLPDSNGNVVNAIPEQPLDFESHKDENDILQNNLEHQDEDTAQPITAEGTKHEHVYSEGVDDDGDLIDYSDNEDLSPVQEAGGLTDANRERNEYDETNEDLKQKSLSRAASRQLNSQYAGSSPVNDAIGNEHSVEIDDHHETTDPNGKWNGEDSDENHEYTTGEHADNEDDHQAGESVPLGEADVANSGESYIQAEDVDALEDPDLGDEVNEEVFEAVHQGRVLQNTISALSNGVNEPLNGFDSSEPNISNGTTSHTEPTTEETQDGSNYHSHNNLMEALASAVNTNVEDEIGYEDDDDLNTTSADVLPQVPTASPSTGKRPRADTDADEAVLMGPKEAKRTRS